MKNVCCLYRVSTDNQDNERQFIDVRNYCKVNDFNIIKEFEAKISGAKENRKEIKDLLEYLNKDSSIEFVVISELSRLGRTNEVLNTIKILNEKKICLISLKDGIKTLDEKKEINQTTALLINVLTGVNAFELSSIKYRSGSGKDAKVISNGSWTGGNNYPYGYMSIEKRLVKNEKEIPIVKLIFDKYLLGWGSQKICSFLSNEGILNRSQLNGKVGKWNKNTIHSMLKNTLYIGKRSWKEEKIEVPELRIIDDYTFETANKRLSSSKNTNFDFNKRKKYEYMFDKQLIKCGICGDHYIPFQTATIKGYYKCHSGKYSKSCGNNSIPVKYLEFVINEHLFYNWLTLISKNIESNSNKDGKQIEIDLLQIEANKEVNKQKRLKELYIDQELSKIEYHSKIDTSKRIYEQLNDKIKELKKEIEVSEIDLKKVLKGAMGYNKETKKHELAELKIEKGTLQQIIKKITITGKLIDVELVNNNKFQLIFDKTRKILSKPTKEENKAVNQ